MDRLLSMRVFEKVIDEGSFAGAARALDMSPPVVTRLVADLEEHLGARLLQRTTRQLSLTDAGQNYLNRVRNILQDIDEAHAMTSAHTSDLSGTLRVHTSPVLATYVVAPVVAQFRRLYPKIMIDLDVESIAMLEIEKFDITLFAVTGKYDADVVARKIMESEAILVASKAYVERRGAPQVPQQLAEHDCLRLRVPNLSYKTVRLQSQLDPSLRVTVEVEPVLVANHIDTLVRASQDGMGIISVSPDLVAPFLADGSMVRVLAPWTTGVLSIYAALPSRKFIPQRIRVFLDFIVEQMRLQAAQLR